MVSDSTYNDIRPSRSSIKRFSFEGSYDNHTSQQSNVDLYSQNEHLSDHPESDSEHENNYHNSDFLTTSIGVPEFDPEVFQGDCLSQNLFDNSEYDVESNHSDERDDCEIVNIIRSSDSHLDSNELATGSSVELVEHLNGSTVNPILVDDSTSELSTQHSNTYNLNNNRLNSITNIRNTNNINRNNNRNNTNNTTTCNLSNTTNDNNNNASSSTGYTTESSSTIDHENEDCIMGPVRFINKRPPQFPIDYYRPTKKISQSYTFLDHEYTTSIEGLEDIEFLFKCPICYSTITRLRSGKVPNESDKVIYSTKCGHLFCYECIENVKRRKECSICRKKVNDRNQFHVIFP